MDLKAVCVLNTMYLKLQYLQQTVLYLVTMVYVNTHTHTESKSRLTGMVHDLKERE